MALFGAFFACICAQLNDIILIALEKAQIVQGEFRNMLLRELEHLEAQSGEHRHINIKCQLLD